MKKTIVVLLALTASCSQEAIEKNEVKNSDTALAEIHEHEHSSAIELDQGKKWKVDENMMVYFTSMEKSISELADKKAVLNEREFDRLAENLEATIDSLTSNCTMEGKGHDELHKWLLPYIDKAEELRLSGTKDSSLVFFTQLDSMYTEFHRYFE